jgi:hypothetical protein
MDLNNIFKEISEQLISEFRKASEVRHSVGKGSLREDAFKNFLKEYLPQRYAIGSGEVISPENKVSGQLDAIIYDPQQCPAFIKSTSHAIYPIESVYGAISIKSHLDSSELEDAYKNIASLKTILRKDSFTVSQILGITVGMEFPMPVTGIVAYASNRSLEAIAAQAKKLDAKLDITLRPDFIAVIGEGIIGVQQPLRSEFNKFSLPQDSEQLVSLRKAGRHTLLRLYMQLLDELNALTLRPLQLSKYYDMPRLVGTYRVRKHNRIVRTAILGGEQKVLRLNEAGIREIVTKSKPVTYRQHLLNYIGNLQENIEEICNPDTVVYEYNPNKLPPISFDRITKNAQGQLFCAAPAFQPIEVEIDDKIYAVDFFALANIHFDNEDNFTAEELMAS